MRVVCDASSLIELVMESERGPRVAAYLEDAQVHVPDVAFVEAAHVLRKAERESVLTGRDAEQSVAYLLSLEVDVWGFHDLAARAWELRHNVSVYDATYVALAEQIEAPLITVDERLARAAGPRCDFIVP